MTADVLTRDGLDSLLRRTGHDRACSTAAGIVSRSVSQTGWAVDTARRLARQHGRAEIADLPDADLVWLLVMGWDPR